MESFYIGNISQHFVQFKKMVISRFAFFFSSFSSSLLEVFFGDFSLGKRWRLLISVIGLTW